MLRRLNYEMVQICVSMEADPLKSHYMLLLLAIRQPAMTWSAHDDNEATRLKSQGHAAILLSLAAENDKRVHGEFMSGERIKVEKYFSSIEREKQ